MVRRSTVRNGSKIGVSRNVGELVEVSVNSHWLRGPLAGEATPVHGGAPDGDGCNGCIDCCHLPEISVTDEEAGRLQALHAAFDQPPGELIIHDDPAHDGWKIMAGPCIFRRYDQPLATGGCTIYASRPVSCDVFTCTLRLELRRAGSRIDSLD